MAERKVRMRVIFVPPVFYAVVAVILWQRCHSPPAVHRCQFLRISEEVNAHRIFNL